MSDICESCGCPEGPDGHDVLHRRIDELEKENKDLRRDLDNSIMISNKNADGELREIKRVRDLASVVHAAERGRTIADAQYAEVVDFMQYATGDPKWSELMEEIRKKWLALTSRHGIVLTEWHPIYLAERALIRAVLRLDSTVREFDGDLKTADEGINALWDTVAKYRNVKLPVVFP